MKSKTKYSIVLSFKKPSYHVRDIVNYQGICQGTGNELTIAYTNIFTEREIVFGDMAPNRLYSCEVEVLEFSSKPWPLESEDANWRQNPPLSNSLSLYFYKIWPSNFRKRIKMLSSDLKATFWIISRKALSLFKERKKILLIYWKSLSISKKTIQRVSGKSMLKW